MPEVDGHDPQVDECDGHPDLGLLQPALRFASIDRAAQTWNTPMSNKMMDGGWALLMRCPVT